ncbi:MAG: hypothetical protein IT354_09965 [Gemmatimonadaceae bacterium]|nr:hypothetical protein [Gemmatimonadaceae bacterium]
MTNVRPLVAGVLAAAAALSACADRPASTADTSAVEVAATPPRDSGAIATTAYVYVSDYGVGDLRAGMTLEQAQRIAADLKPIARTDSTECSYLDWPSAPPGVLVMYDGGRIARFDIDSAGVRTAAGAQVGDSEARVDSLYAGRVTTTPHKYTDGHYLTVTPPRAADSLFRLVFEAEGGTITRYRVGIMPQVQYVEGCS